MRNLIIAAALTTATLGGTARADEVQRCTTGDHCVMGIVVSDKPTAAQIRAIEQGTKAGEDAEGAAQQASFARSLQKFPESIPGDSEGVTMAKAAVFCAANGKYCIDHWVEERRKIEKIWEYIDLSAEPRAKIREIIAKRSVGGKTDWQSVGSDYSYWLISSGRQSPPPTTSGGYVAGGIHSSCTLRTTTTGSLGNQVITSTMDCY